MNHPIQPIIDGRFKKNEIVSTLLDWASSRGMSLNEIACMDFSDEDHQQFAQLIGYSVDGYGTLSYVSDYAYATAILTSEGTNEKDARIAYLEGELTALKEALQQPMARLFELHPDDLSP